MSIIVTSSELPELITLCDRILVLCEGRVTGELARGEFTGLDDERRVEVGRDARALGLIGERAHGRLRRRVSAFSRSSGRYSRFWPAFWSTSTLLEVPSTDCIMSR